MTMKYDVIYVCIYSILYMYDMIYKAVGLCPHWLPTNQYVTTGILWLQMITPAFPSKL